MNSVTQVLDYFCEPELLAWYLGKGKAACEKISTEAKRIGKEVDHYIQNDLAHIDEPLPTQDVAIMNCWTAWMQFKQENPKIIQGIVGMQTELMDSASGIVGHPDLEIIETFRWGIIDIKTSKAIQPKHWTQVVKYLDLKYPQFLQADSIPHFPYFVGILRLDKLTGKYEYRELTNPSILLYEVKVFDAYYTAYQHGQEIREVMRLLREQEALDVA